ANGQDMEAREQMAYAQSLAGMAFNNAGLGCVHAIAHQFGGFYNLPHGVCNAILLPHVSRFNLMAKIDRYADIAEFLCEKVEGLSEYDAALLTIRSIERVSELLNIHLGFILMVADEADIHTFAENAMNDVTAATKARRLTLE